MTFQIVEVIKPLGSVRAMLDAGNKVVFEKDNSYISDKSGKVKTTIQERNGAFVFDLWMPKGNEATIAKAKDNRYQALMEEDEDNEDFARRGDLFN